MHACMLLFASVLLQAQAGANGEMNGAISMTLAVAAREENTEKGPEKNLKPL